MYCPRDGPVKTFKFEYRFEFKLLMIEKEIGQTKQANLKHIFPYLKLF